MIDLNSINLIRRSDKIVLKTLFNQKSSVVSIGELKAEVKRTTFLTNSGSSLGFVDIEECTNSLKKRALIKQVGNGDHTEFFLTEEGKEKALLLINKERELAEELEL